MNTAASLAPVSDAPGAEQVAAYLAENPDFLVRHPELYRSLVPPKRVHGEVLADHMAAMVAAERGRVRAMEAEIEAALADGRAGAALVVRVRLAVLALMRSRDVAETVSQELPPLLRVECCTLLAEPAAGGQRGVFRAGVGALPAGMVVRLVGRGREARVRSEVTDAVLLHAEAAALIVRDALVRVPLCCGTPCLLAVGAREAAALPARQTVTTLAFLGRVVAAALSR